MIKLIVEGKELTDISQHALKWFLESIMNGKEGPFTVQTYNGTTHAIILKTDEQLELFG